MRNERMRLMDGIDPETNDQHGDDTIEAGIVVGLTFLAMIPVVVFDMARDWLWRNLHDY